MADFTVYPDKEPSKTARALAEQIEHDGGHVLAIYQEPVGEHWQIFCLLPRTKVRSEERRVGKECRSRWSPYH